jgi:hypothetical protein
MNYAVDGTCVTYGGMRKAYKILVWEPEAKKPLVRPENRWKKNTKLFLKEACGGVEWIGLVQNRVQWRAFVNIRRRSNPFKNLKNVQTFRKPTVSSMW